MEKEAEISLEQHEESSKVLENLKINRTVALNRYIFMAEVNSYFVNTELNQLKCNKMKLRHSTGTDICNYLKNLAETDKLAPMNIIKKALLSKSLYSNCEAFWCLAYCLTELKNEDLRKEIRKNFLELIVTSEQLLIFIYAYQLLKGGKMNFGRGMRNVLEKWYASKTATELFEILYSSLKFEKVDHKSILHQLHLKLEDREKNKIIHSIYRCEDKLEKETESTPLDKMIIKYRQLKHCKETQEVVAILKAKDFNYKLQNIPTFACKSHEAVDLIIANMSLNEVIDNLLLFCSHKMLRVNEPVSKKICSALQVPNKIINEAKLNPIHVFQVIKELEKRLTIFHQDAAIKTENGNAPTTAVVAVSAEDKSKEKKFSNPFILKRLQHIFNHTLNEQSKTGCRYFITVDFRSFSKRQSKVFGMRNILCSELQAIFALTLLKNEKEVTIMSFTDSNNKLKPVEWNSETNFDKAMEIYEKEITEHRKTKEIVSLPLKKAIEDKKKIDVFITFVSSLGRRFGNHGKPDQLFAELQNYRKVMNLKMTKYIIINMTRKSPDIQYDDKNINNKGILEIVGFSEKSAKIVEAYAKNCFA